MKPRLNYFDLFIIFQFSNCKNVLPLLPGNQIESGDQGKILLKNYRNNELLLLVIKWFMEQVLSKTKTIILHLDMSLLLFLFSNRFVRRYLFFQFSLYFIIMSHEFLRTKKNMTVNKYGF